MHWTWDELQALPEDIYVVLSDELAKDAQQQRQQQTRH
jgi:hypothetical protein